MRAGRHRRIGFNDDGRPPLDTDLDLLSDVRRGPDGRIYLMDFNNMRLRVIGDDGLVETIAGNGVHGYAFTGVQATDSPLENPIDFAFLPDGQIAIVSYHDPRILVFGPDGVLHAIAGDGKVGRTGDEGDGGAALSAEFIQLDGIAVGADGALYVSDSLANRVRMVKDGVVTTVAGTGEGAYAGDGGPATEAALHWPTALNFDAAGNLLIADQENHAIRRIAPDGTITTVAGTGEAGFGGDGGPATDARLDEPDGVVAADDGTLYIADRTNHRIRMVAPDGTISTIAGTGDKGFSGGGGPALEATFGFVARVQLDGDCLLVADQSNSCAREIFLR